MQHLRLFLLFILAFSATVNAQQNGHFNGALTYRIERVDVADSVQAKMIIFARDSMIKIVNFSTDFGKQETIKHLVYQKKYVLIDLDGSKFAIQMKDSSSDQSEKSYRFRKIKGHEKIAGIKGKKLAFQYKLMKNELTIVYTDKIPAKYLDAYTDAPGLLLQYYVVNDHGLFKYTLESIDYKTPPLTLFMIPSDYQRISFKDFIEKQQRAGHSSIPNN
ncbi:MAG: hypothetical protein RLZZ30_1523 [Bacteroidota bacterium]|jgi:hypothetical protein